MVEASERVWRFIEPSVNGCWLWSGAKKGGLSYGLFGLSHSQLVQAHRYVYSLLIGDIPAGLCLDHLCRNKSCVNPLHCEPVTQKTNIMRGGAPSAVNARKTHCLRGHEFTDENTLRVNGRYGVQRSCRTCHREKMRRRRG